MQFWLRCMSACIFFEETVGSLRLQNPTWCLSRPIHRQQRSRPLAAALQHLQGRTSVEMCVWVEVSQRTQSFQERSWKCKRLGPSWRMRWGVRDGACAHMQRSHQRRCPLIGRTAPGPVVMCDGYTWHLMSVPSFKSRSRSSADCGICVSPWQPARARPLRTVRGCTACAIE